MVYKVADETLKDVIRDIEIFKETNVEQVRLNINNGVPSANGEFVSIRRFPLISHVILYNKECFQNNSKNQLDNSGICLVGFLNACFTCANYIGFSDFPKTFYWMIPVHHSLLYFIFL